MDRSCKSPPSLLARRQHAIAGLYRPGPHHAGIGIAEFMSKVFNE